MKGREFFPRSHCHISTVPQHHVTTESPSPGCAWFRRTIRTSCLTVLHLCSCCLFCGSHFWDDPSPFLCVGVPCSSKWLPPWVWGGLCVDLSPHIHQSQLFIKDTWFLFIYSFDDNFLTRKKNHLLFTFTSCAIFLEELNENH